MRKIIFSDEKVDEETAEMIVNYSEGAIKELIKCLGDKFDVKKFLILEASIGLIIDFFYQKMRFIEVSLVESLKEKGNEVINQNALSKGFIERIEYYLKTCREQDFENSDVLKNKERNIFH